MPISSSLPENRPVLVDRSHRSWMTATATLLAAATTAYIAYVRNSPGGPQGGSAVGLLFGIAGSALMIYASLLWVRKRLPRWHVGTAQSWLRGHIWLGSLSVPIILFHAGFRWGGAVECALWGVLAAIVISGLFGLALQQFLPRDLTSRVPLETFYDQVPHVCQMLQLEADVLVAGLCGPLVIEPLALATDATLAGFGVTGRDPLRKVYLLPSEPSAASGTHRKPGTGAAAVESDTAAPTPAAATSEPAKGLSAAEKIAAMKAAKKVIPPAPDAAMTTDAAQTHTTESSPQLPPQVPAKALSAAEKIAAMRAMKASKGPAAGDPATVAAKQVNTEDAVSAGAEPKPATPKAMTAAEKIAAMRATKAGAAPSVTPAASAAPAQPGKPSSAAEKIAAMRAAKAATGSNTTASAETSPAQPTPLAAPMVATAKAVVVKTPKTSDAWKRACPELLKFYLGEVRPFLDVQYRRRNPLDDGSSGSRVIATAKATLPAEMHAALARIAELCEERRQLATQVRMHHWLHGWELVHLPLTVALYVLGVVHAVVSIYY